VQRVVQRVVQRAPMARQVQAVLHLQVLPQGVASRLMQRQPKKPAKARCLP